MKKILSIIFAISIIFAFASCKGTTTPQDELVTPILDEDDGPAMNSYVLENYEFNNNDLLGRGEPVNVEISVKDYGKIVVELNEKVAPRTVDNFVTLVKEKFYDGLTFHRIISGFMIQGGDPNGDGSGGSGMNIIGEFSDNGFPNDLSHKRGVISMARAMDPNSASSQFFICHQDAEYLDGQYATFGVVTSGMDVVDKICDTVENDGGNGSVAKENQPIIEYIKILE